MNKISINLLPQEIVLTEKDQIRQRKFTAFSILALIIMVVIIAAIFSIRLVQKAQLSSAAQKLNDSRQKVLSYQDTEGLVNFLKQRLSVIGGLVTQESKQATSYNLVTALTPPGINLLALSVNKDGKIIVSAQSSDIGTLDLFFSNLTDPSKNQSKVKKINIDSLTKGVDSYRVDLTITI